MTPTHAVVSALTRLRGDFSPGAGALKAQLVAQLAQASIPHAPTLLRAHDELLFLAAFPDSRALADAASRALAQFDERTCALRPPQRRALADTGIAGTTSQHTFMHGVVRWLVAHGEAVTPQWVRERDAERLDPLIRRSMLPAESDGFDESGLSTREWLHRASAGLRGHEMQWLVGGPAGDGDLYDEAEVPVAWSIGQSPRSVSRNRAPTSRRVTRSGFRRLPADPVAFIQAPLTRWRLVTGDLGLQWRNAALAAIVARCREVAPTTYANPQEVYVADLGEGAQLCVIGAHPDDRLALEANYGYVMFSNGVPIGYGGVTPLADQANTGANIFEAFRGSEAAFFFAQALRAFRGLFGISRFIVNPYQFGAGNDEALRSGAWWFYDRLGFRAADPATRLAARRERARLAAHRGARSSRAMLRRLARSDVVLDLEPGAAVQLFDERWLARVGQLVAASWSVVSAADRPDHLKDMATALKRELTGSARAPTPTESRGARYLGPVIDLIRGEVRRWSASDRRALWELVVAKGSARERRYAQLARAHVRFWRALAARCGDT